MYLMLLDATNIYDVALALIAAIPSIVAAIFAGIVASRTKTSNGTTVGRAAELSHNLAVENNAILRDQQGLPVAEPEH